MRSIEGVKIPCGGASSSAETCSRRIARESFIGGLNVPIIIAGVVALVGAVLGVWLVRSQDFVVTTAPDAAPAG